MTAGRDRTDADPAPSVVERSATALLGGAALVLGAVPFLLLLLLVQRSWAPLAALDGEVAARLNAAVAERPTVVRGLRILTDGGGTGTATYVLVLATAWLLVRRQRRLAAYVTVTGLGLAVLVPVAKALVGRERPDVLLPVVGLPGNASFPSGHAMTSLVTCGVLLLLVLPTVRRRRRSMLIVATGWFVAAVGFTRLALGVHFVTDVLAGWAMGAAWLLVTTAAFRGWQPDARRWTPPADRGPVAGTAGVTARLLLAWVAVFAGLTCAGLLVTQVLDGTAVGRFDAWAVRVLLAERTPVRTEVVQAVAALSGTRTVTYLAIGAAVLALAFTASRRPVVFVAVAVLGEVALYAAVARVVGRPRPGVPDLTSQLPTGASWPSGHVAAAAVTYGALAVLVLTYGAHRHRGAVLLAPVLLVPAIALARVYVAAHHPTDVLAGAVLGLAWLLVVTRLVLPASTSPPHPPDAGRTEPTVRRPAGDRARGSSRPVRG